MSNKKIPKIKFIHAAIAGATFMFGASVLMFSLRGHDMYFMTVGIIILLYSIYFYYKAQQIEKAVDELVEATKTNR